MRVAIVHYWFLVNGGGERVVEVLGDMYPEADIFCLFAEPDSIPASLRSHKVTTSFLNRSNVARRYNREVFPLYPVAIESLDLRSYDLVITSDSPPMKGVITGGDQMHICYCHTPGRYLWDSYSAFKESLPWLLRPVFSAAAGYLRGWDYVAAQRVDYFIANSKHVASRILAHYERDSTVIYPPVDTSLGYLEANTDDYYLHVGRLVHSKRVDLMIEACNGLGRRLLIAGTGREEKALKSIAGPTVEFLGRVEDAALPKLYAKSRALLFAAEEDFGIVPLEAQSYGRPVIAYGKGGSLETVRGYDHDSPRTGLYFNAQTAQSISKGILKFESIEHTFAPTVIQEFARTFDKSVFIERKQQFVGLAVAS
jgi:glycosyltransferase involved in cell wall biosynthesis